MGVDLIATVVPRLDRYDVRRPDGTGESPGACGADSVIGLEEAICSVGEFRWPDLPGNLAGTCLASECPGLVRAQSRCRKHDAIWCLRQRFASAYCSYGRSRCVVHRSAGVDGLPQDRQNTLRVVGLVQLGW